MSARTRPKQLSGHQSISIDAALQDKMLLGAALGSSPDTWRTWITALKAAHGQQLSPDELVVFKPDRWKQTATHPARA
jgi:hypothetical protein